MGYFNYFIKCVIRNITYKLCKPKVFVVVLLSVVILMCFRNYGYCAEVPVDGTVEIDGTVTTNPTETDGDVVTQYDNQTLTLRQIQEQWQMNFISKMYLMYNTDEQANVKYFLSLIMQELLSGTYGANGIMIWEPYKGQQYGVIVYNKHNVVASSGLYGFHQENLQFENVPYSTVGNLERYVGTNNSLYPAEGVVSNISAPTAFFDVFIPQWIDMFIDFGMITADSDAEIISRLDQIIQNNQSSSIKDAIEQGNQLQEENNQIQQEQNDFLKQDTTDSDVSIDSFNSVDSNDITSSGLTGIFNSIYNSISSWSSKDIVLPVPFSNKSIKIQANYTNNMLNSVGGQTLINIVSTIYYFLVARFIIYSITGIINSIKSGSILETDTKTNITTDML